MDDNDVLQHWGVLGQHWGVITGGKSGKGSKGSTDHRTTSTIQGKKVSEMSNEEIHTLTNRLQLENQYKNLRPSKVTRGKNAVNNALSGIGKLALTAGAVVTLVETGTKIYGYAKKAGAGRAASSKFAGEVATRLANLP